MAEKTTYGVKGTLRDECMTDRTALDGFRPLESDWRELFRWLMSVSGDIPYYDGETKESGRLSSLWENHVLTVLVDILRKDIDGYVDSFVGGRGTSAQQRYTERLEDSFRTWAERLGAFIRQSRSTRTGSPSVEVAELLLSRLENALPKEREPRRKRHARFPDNANQSYFRMLGTVADIQKHADEYISRIESGGDMDPSLALLLTFVRNYCGIAERFNRRFRDWAGFYRRNILHDTPKEAVQDSTLVVIEPDRKNMEGTFPLPAGTTFLAGKKADGSDLLYATAEKEYIVPAHILAAHCLFRKEARLYAAALPAGGEDGPCPLFDTKNPAASALEYGWLLTSRSLVLSEGRRTVTVCIRLEGGEGDSMPDLSCFDGNTAAFILQLSGGEGWRQKEEYTMEADPGQGMLRLTVTLNEGEEAPAPCTEELHGIATVYPALRILSADSTATDALPCRLYVKEITLHTEAEGIRNFTLMGESGQADPSQPFYPFGPTGERGSRLVFGHEEAALKDITSVTLKGTWMKLPVNGFKPIYEHYGLEKPVDGSSFTVRCEWQEESRWHECAASPQPLFRMDGSGRLTDEAVFELVLEEKRAADGLRLMPYRRDSNGFYRLILDSPETGFGTNTYYRRFTEVMLHNGREKEKHRLPVPEQPQVPMLCDMTFGYKSSETLAPGSLYRINGLWGYEACPDAGRKPFLFMPQMDAPSLVVGMDNMGDTSRTRFYFDLRYAMRGGMPVAEQPDCALRISRYAGNGAWAELPPEDILCEETDGMTRSGFIELKVREGTKDQGLWLKFAFDGNAGPENMVLGGIHLNCVRVRAIGGDGSSLPAGTIAAPSVEDSRILSVWQPFAGSGGKPAETGHDAAIRQRIRISTRNRAVCGGNYEEMVLERFPEIEKACCIPASGNDGTVRIVVLPKPEKRSYPFLPGWKLSEIENHIRQYASPFAKIEAVNPVYEPLSVTFRAVLKEGTPDPGAVKRRIARRIWVFLMAWYMDGRLPDFGVRYSCDALLSRTANDEDIEEFVSLEIRTGNRLYRITEASHGEDTVLSASDGCGVLYIDTLDVELADSRRGVDEGKIGTDFMIG